ncbi:GNAT family N-acetyltransferase [Nocardioides coralli]|uniref:GNAT family N-acetyltransferase n=1 Tax=Nocardioides coralli TaxID=2872154 RepID=UPI001CA3CBB1|nr:GNAT family N-acetyltransferase [Nocardioides coralli]QZY30416.1 GNAT family N-acetyltransferase [Nocardioides coralli]
MEIRPARESDLVSVAAIYEREAREGPATFDTEGRSPATWRGYLESCRPGDHFLVAVDHELLGFAYSSTYRPKPGYDTTRETTVYVAPGAQGRGVGSGLYAELLPRLAEDGIHLALAGVALPNDASRALHRAHGFEPVGVMCEVGRKLDRWVDVEWWQRRL